MLFAQKSGLTVKAPHAEVPTAGTRTVPWVANILVPAESLGTTCAPYWLLSPWVIPTSLALRVSRKLLRSEMLVIGVATTGAIN
jgi:hypothetical protein